MKYTSLLCATFLSFGPAKADINIVTDIAPLGSLIEMAGGKNVTIMVEPGQSPHDASLKPSVARALRDADLVIWMGEAMAPGLAKPIDQLAGNATVLEMLEIEGIDYLDFREEAAFDDHDDHKDEHGEHEEHSDHKDDGAHEDHDAQDDHKDADAHDEHDHHAHDGVDPHAWLSLEVAEQWIDVIADLLAKADPENDAVYSKKSAEAADVLAEIEEEFEHAFGGHSDGHDHADDLMSDGRPVVASHDAFQYLEDAFGLKVVAAVTDADGTSASAARVAEVTDAVEETAPVCLISDTAQASGAEKRMADTLGLKLVPLDILGARHAPGAGMYGQIMNQIAVDLKDCL